MNAFDIPTRSCFASDPEFQRRPQHHRGGELTLPKREKLARIKPEPKPHKPRTGGRSGGAPRSVFVDPELMLACRNSGHSWAQVGSVFGCSGEYARTLILKLYPGTKRYLRGPVTARRKDLNTDEMRAAYERLGTFGKVATLYGCDVGTVIYRLRDAPCYFVQAGDRDREALNGAN